MSGLTEFQADVARLFFSLPASEGFLLAGGGALLASGLTTRPTEDLDFFGERGRANVAAARDQLEAAVTQRGWSVDRVQDSGTFVRMHLHGRAPRARSGGGSRLSTSTTLCHAGNAPAATTGASTKELMARMGDASPRAALIYQRATHDRDAAIARALSDLIESRARGADDTVLSDRRRPVALITWPSQTSLEAPP